MHRRMALAIIAIAVVCSVSAFAQGSSWQASSYRHPAVEVGFYTENDPMPEWMYRQYKVVEAVRPGLTMWDLAIRYGKPGTDYKVLKRINTHIKNASRIWPGDHLAVPNDWVESAGIVRGDSTAWREVHQAAANDTSRKTTAGAAWTVPLWPFLVLLGFIVLAVLLRYTRLGNPIRPVTGGDHIREEGLRDHEAPTYFASREGQRLTASGRSVPLGLRLVRLRKVRLWGWLYTFYRWATKPVKRLYTGQEAYWGSFTDAQGNLTESVVLAGCANDVLLGTRYSFHGRIEEVEVPAEGIPVAQPERPSVPPAAPAPAPEPTPARVEPVPQGTATPAASGNHSDRETAVRIMTQAGGDAMHAVPTGAEFVVRVGEAIYFVHYSTPIAVRAPATTYPVGDLRG